MVLWSVKPDLTLTQPNENMAHVYLPRLSEYDGIPHVGQVTTNVGKSAMLEWPPALRQWLQVTTDREGSV